MTNHHTADAEALGWPPGTCGEKDHRDLKAPTLKLRTAHTGKQGDHVFYIDLRIRKPNKGQALAVNTLHSMEHFLLEGFNYYLPENFLSVGIMGCRTGFYLGFINEGRAPVIIDVLAKILTHIQTAQQVPYASITQCGNYRDHDIEQARQIAQEIQAARQYWLEAL